MDEVPLTFDVPSNRTVTVRGSKTVSIKVFFLVSFALFYTAFNNICINTLKTFFPESDLLKCGCVLYDRPSYMLSNTVHYFI